MSTNKTQNYQLHVPVDVGSGRQTIVYLHGINGNGQSFNKVIARLKMAGRRVIAPDMLGYGKSPKPLDIKYSIDDHVDALHYTLQEMGVKPPFILVGYSMGGVIAPRYASRYPEDVVRLILISAPFYLKPGDMVSSRYVKSVFATGAWHKVWDWAQHLSTRNQRLFRYLSSENIKFIQGAINASDLATDWPIFQKCIHNTIEKSTLGPDLRKIKCPTTFIVGKKDAIVVTDQLDALMKFKPDLEIRRISTIKADHFVLDNLPGQIASELERAIDIKLHINQDVGHGETIVFLHGIEGSADYWHDYVTCLSKRYRVISIDLLGFGRSSKPLNIDYGIDVQVRYLLETFDSLNVKNIIIVGHSLGSLVGLGLTVARPKLVKRLVLYEPVIMSLGTRIDTRSFATFKDSALGRVFVLRQKVTMIMQKRAVKDLLGEDNLQNYIPTLRSIENIVEKQTIASDFKKITNTPITMVYGSRDTLVSEDRIERLASQHQNVTTLKVRAGHNAPLERPVECLQVIDQTISEEAIKAVFGRPKKRIAKSEMDKKLRYNSLILLFRGLVNLIFGLGLVFGRFPARWLVVGVVVYVLIVSATMLSQSITLRGERFNWIVSAVMGVVGLILGIFLMLDPPLNIQILFNIAAIYILIYGLMYISVGLMVSDGQRPAWQMTTIGIFYIVISFMLFAQNDFGIKLVGYALAGVSIFSGVLLIGYASLTYLLSRRTSQRAKF